MDFILDAGIIILLLLFIALSIKRGFAAELRGFTGWVIIILISLRFGALVGDYFSKHIESISTVSSYVGFIVLVIILKLIFTAAAQMFESNDLALIDKLFSAITGLISGALLLSIVFIILSSTPVQKKVQPYVEKSVTYPYLYGFSTEFVNVLTRFVPQLDTLYERMLNGSSRIEENTSKVIQEKVKQFRKQEE